MFVLALVHTQIMVAYGMSKKSRQLVNSSARYDAWNSVLKFNVRKSIWRVKKLSDEVLAWLSV